MKPPAPPTLLVVEDELEVADYLRDYFQAHGVKVLNAHTGEQALEAISSGQPAAVLLDLKLGSGMSGIEVLRQVRANRSTIPVIVLTAVDDQNMVDMAKGIGATDYLTKPFSVTGLEKAVLPYLKQAVPDQRPGTAV